MAYLRVLCLLQILQNGTCGNHTTLQMLHTKALQVFYTEMFQQLLTCRLVRIYPVVQLKREELRAKFQFKILLATTLEEHLLWREVA